MGAWLDRLAAAPRPPLWLDDIAYTERLLANGAAPWLDVAALVSWRRKALTLLRPDVMTLPLAPLTHVWIREHESLQREMSARRRVTAPLRTLLASAELRAHIGASLQALRASASLPLALVIPSPRRWVADAQRMALGESTPADEESSDSASVLIADFLRAFGECGIDVLLLEEGALASPASSGELEWYRSTINVARHYGWDVGLRTSRSIDGSGEVDFVVAPDNPRYLELGEGFWSAGAIPPPVRGGLRLVTIPPNAEPQSVLSRLETLR